MTHQTTQNITLALIVVAFVLLTNLVTCLFWQHSCVVHHAAFFEANNWGWVSFHWDDVSYAHAPFQDPDPIAQKMEQAFQAKLKALDLK
jgi:hypothetical protein